MLGLRIGVGVDVGLVDEQGWEGKGELEVVGGIGNLGIL